MHRLSRWSGRWGRRCWFRDLSFVVYHACVPLPRFSTSATCILFPRTSFPGNESERNDRGKDFERNNALLRLPPELPS